MAYRGKVVLLNFWASWCPPCRIEIPSFVDLKRVYGSRGFEVIGVAMDESGWVSVRPFMDALNVNYPVVLGDDELAEQYGAHNLPITFLIDRQGRIAARHLGIASVSDVESEIIQLMQGTNPGGPVPAGADGVGTPSCLSCPFPEYSEQARRARFEGDVYVSCVVGVDGRATQLKVLNAPPFGLGSKASEAVRRWGFKPAAGPDGKPVAVITTLRVHFSLLQDAPVQTPAGPR
jgi:TonB family protein